LTGTASRPFGLSQEPTETILLLPTALSPKKNGKQVNGTCSRKSSVNLHVDLGRSPIIGPGKPSKASMLHGAAFRVIAAHQTMTLNHHHIE
jgi:hypothetical protein